MRRLTSSGVFVLCCPPADSGLADIHCLLQAPEATQVVPGVVQGPLAAQVGCQATRPLRVLAAAPHGVGTWSACTPDERTLFVTLPPC